jgi:uncharacterized protein (TIGR02145 family)
MAADKKSVLIRSIRVIRVPKSKKQFNNSTKKTIMKKLYFYLLFLPLWGLVGIAHASVAVQVLNTDFTNKTVTLHVEYANAVNDRVWVWIYLCSMQGMFEPAEISAASATSGSMLYTATNTRGFFVTSSPATVTATLSNVSGQFSCCAYGSDTPPNMTGNNGTYTFKGTPPFILTAADAATTQTVTENTLPASALAITPVTITDGTGYPDIFSFCLYTGSDLYMDASHLCQQRTSGAQNWEAWIKDTRDDKLYRIVRMPDNKWWLAQNVRYAGAGAVGSSVSVSGCTEETCGRFYTTAQFNAAHGGSSGYGENKQGVCPPEWVLPTNSDWQTFHNSLGSSDAERTSRIRAANSTCSPITDYFGFANPRMFAQSGTTTGSAWFCNRGSGSWYRFDHVRGQSTACNEYEITNNESTYNWAVRCFRNL